MPTYDDVTIAQVISPTEEVISTGGVASLTTGYNVLIRLGGIPRTGKYLEGLSLNISVTSLVSPTVFSVDFVKNDSAPLTLGKKRYQYEFVRSYTIPNEFSTTFVQFNDWFSPALAERWRYHPRQGEEAILFRLRMTSPTGFVAWSSSGGEFTSLEMDEPVHTPSGMRYIDDPVRGVGKKLAVCARTDRVYPEDELVVDPVTGLRVHHTKVDLPPSRRTRSWES